MVEEENNSKVLSSQWEPDSVMGTIPLTAENKMNNIPTASGTAGDPLGVSRTWKRWSILLLIYFLANVTFIASQTSVVRFLRPHAPIAIHEVTDNYGNVTFKPDISAEQEKRLDAEDLLWTIPRAFTLLSTLLYVPISRLVGQKGIVLGSMFCAIFSLVMAATVADMNANIAALCLLYLAIGALQTMTTVVITDLTRLHERNRALGLVPLLVYIFTAGHIYLSALIMTSTGWVAMYGLSSISLVLSGLLVLGIVPNTAFFRYAGDVVGAASSVGDDRAVGEKTAHGWRASAKVYRTWDWTLKFARVIMLPIVLWAALVSSLQGYTMDQSSADIYSSRHGQASYDVNSERLGFYGYLLICQCAGNLVAYIITGILGDRLSMILTKRRGNVRESEHQLINFPLPMAMGLAGAAMATYYATLTTDPNVIPLIGIAFLSFSASTKVVVDVYALESYPTMVGYVASTVHFLRELVFIVLTLSSMTIQPDADYNLAPRLLGLSVAMFVLCMLGIPVWVFGKRLRKRWDMRPESPGVKILAS